MKLLNYLLVVVLFVSACKKESEDAPTYSKDYGSGMYIVTENGISFYDGEVVKNQIYKKVNGSSILNGKKIKFSGTKAYIVTDNQILTANVKTFENKEEINGFTNAVDLDFVSYNRLFVVDKGDSRVKVVDLLTSSITSDIETGDHTQPVFIVSNSYKSFVLNGGGVATQTKDSTVVVIEYRDDLVELADFIGDLSVGDNPNSAVLSGRLKVLSQGVYDPINSINNTESSLSDVNQYSNQVYSTNTLTGIYNAQNLISNWNNSICYLTAEGGVYSLNESSLNANLLVSVNASIINAIVESFPDTDTTFVSSQMLYMNDLDNPNTIYKYNFELSLFTDTIIVDGAVKDIAFY